MNKIILALGIQGSGKTYWSKNWAKEDPLHRIRLNYDDIRNMFGKYWVLEREDLVICTFKSSLNLAMIKGLDIVIDNFSNLNPKHQKEYQEIVEIWNKENPDIQYEIELKLFATPLETCLERDARRENPIGEQVIRSCWKKYRTYIVSMQNQNILNNRIKYNPDFENCIIVDMDGTLCFNTNSRPFYGEGAAEGMLLDVPNKPIVDLVKNCKSNYKIIVITGRDTSCSESTTQWLLDNEITPSLLLMRQAGDYRSSEIVKKELYETYIKDKCNVALVIDDEPKCIEMYTNLGLPCFKPI